MNNDALTWPPARRIMPEGLYAWTMPVSFSQGWVCGPLLFVGGQIATGDPGVAVASDDIEEQTRIVFENIGKVLEEAGTSFKHLVKFNTYYVFDGPDDELQEYWEKMTRVRLQYLPSPGPAGTAVRVSGLAYPGLLLEVEAIAYDPSLVQS
ncbi:RidA family protein [Microbacterium alcoholitolerans]|uniref:RidA family protein n=1 Tax=unclassified Microbacterium TaxID=2609290 RepID=UPI003D1640DE